MGSQRLLGQMTPEALAETAHGRDGHDFAGMDPLGRGQAAKVIVEIGGAAEVENAADIGQAGGVMQPSAAVQKRHAAHPVGMFVENEQIAGLPEPAEEGEGDMVEIAGADERNHGFGVGRAQEVIELAFKTVEALPAASQANLGAPPAQVVNVGPKGAKQAILGWNAAVQIDDTNPHEELRTVHDSNRRHVNAKARENKSSRRVAWCFRSWHSVPNESHAKAQRRKGGKGWRIDTERISASNTT